VEAQEKLARNVNFQGFSLNVCLGWRIEVERTPENPIMSPLNNKRVPAAAPKNDWSDVK
jgi:hypothetical protein